MKTARARVRQREKSALGPIRFAGPSVKAPLFRERRRRRRRHGFFSALGTF
jgi:hypothetical protein